MRYGGGGWYQSPPPSRFSPPGHRMPHYLLLCRSITYAQRMSGALERAGISARVLRPPVGLTDRGCGYAVRVAAPYFSMAMELQE